MTLFIRELDSKPLDAFVVLGRSGSDITAFTEAIGRLVSLGLRSNMPIEILAENLVGLGGRTSVGFGPERTLSVPDAIGKILYREYCSKSESRSEGEICPDCKNASLEYTEGCLKCPLCGFAEC
jgi:ribonucleoside-diphosphate reductase alpha chain